MQRVVCAVDLSEDSVELLQYAHTIVQRYGGCLTVLHAVPTFDAIETHAGDWFDPVTVVRPLRRDAVIERMRLMVVAAGISHDRVRCEAEAGRAAPTIVGRALALVADTIVLGAHARHGAERLLLGSTTDAVLRHAPCDVLTVPPQCATSQNRLRRSSAASISRRDRETRCVQPSAWPIGVTPVSLSYTPSSGSSKSRARIGSTSISEISSPASSTTHSSTPTHWSAKRRPPTR